MRICQKPCRAEGALTSEVADKKVCVGRTGLSRKSETATRWLGCAASALVPEIHRAWAPSMVLTKFGVAAGVLAHVGQPASPTFVSGHPNLDSWPTADDAELGFVRNSNFRSNAKRARLLSNLLSKFAK